MKIVCVSDIHSLWEKPVARLDDAKVTLLTKLRFILKWAKDNKAIIIVAGDFTNKPRSWYLLPELIVSLKEFSVPVYAVYGQHDTYLYNKTTRKSTNLGILELTGLVKILDDVPLIIGEDIRLYGTSHGQDIPKPDVCCMNILTIHAAIADQALWSGQNYMDALQFLKQNKEYEIIIAGDIHQKFLKEYDGRYILNSGPLIRKEASVYNFQHKPGFYVVDTASNKEPVFIEVPHEPAELVLTRSHIDYKEDTANLLTEFIESVQSIEIDEDVSITENIWRVVKKNNVKQSVCDVLAEIMSR